MALPWYPRKGIPAGYYFDWTSNYVVGSNYSKSISQCMLDTIYDTSFEQIVDFTIRGNRTLDIFITNRPSFIERSNSLPWLRDHDMIVLQARTKAPRQKHIRERYFCGKGPTRPSYALLYKTSLTASYRITLPPLLLTTCGSTLHLLSQRS